MPWASQVDEITQIRLPGKAFGEGLQRSTVPRRPHGTKLHSMVGEADLAGACQPAAAPNHARAGH
jgi:hypothetical protein